MRNRDVTVVVPTHNRRDLVAVTLRSILGQRGVDPEVIVVDDGSSDGTGAFLRTAFGDRLRVARIEESGGAAAARNLGLGLVTTPWVAFCDDDDLWAPDKLAAQLDAVAAHGEARWSVTGAVCIDEGLRVTEAQQLGHHPDLVAALLERNVLPGGGSGVVAETHLVRDVGGFRVEQLSSEDWDLWIRLAVQSPLAEVDRPLVAYRVWSGGKSRKAERMAMAFDAITTRYADLAADRGVRPDKAGHQRFLAKQELRAGDRVGAARRFASLGQRGRAVIALLAPRTMDRVGSARQRHALPGAWVAEADAWLPAVAGWREPVVPTSPGADAR